MIKLLGILPLQGWEADAAGQEGGQEPLRLDVLAGQDDRQWRRDEAEVEDVLHGADRDLP